MSDDCRAVSALVPCAEVAKEEAEEPESFISLPVVVSKAAKLESIALAGHVTSPEPPQTATRGLVGVPAPVTVIPSTEICTIGLAGSVLSVFNQVTVSTEPPPPHGLFGLSRNIRRALQNQKYQFQL